MVGAQRVNQNWIHGISRHRIRYMRIIYCELFPSSSVTPPGTTFVFIIVFFMVAESIFFLSATQRVS